MSHSNQLSRDTKMKLELTNQIIRNQFSQSNQPSRDIFDDALGHIVELMRRDSFRRYQAELTAQAEIKTQAHK